MDLLLTHPSNPNEPYTDALNLLCDSITISYIRNPNVIPLFNGTTIILDLQAAYWEITLNGAVTDDYNSIFPQGEATKYAMEEAIMTWGNLGMSFPPELKGVSRLIFTPEGSPNTYCYRAAISDVKFDFTPGNIKQIWKYTMKLKGLNLSYLNGPLSSVSLGSPPDTTTSIEVNGVTYYLKAEKISTQINKDLTMLVLPSLENQNNPNTFHMDLGRIKKQTTINGTVGEVASDGFLASWELEQLIGIKGGLYLGNGVILRVVSQIPSTMHGSINRLDRTMVSGAEDRWSYTIVFDEYLS